MACGTVVLQTTVSVEHNKDSVADVADVAGDQIRHLGVAEDNRRVPARHRVPLRSIEYEAL